jgi:hypothetical protein
MAESAQSLENSSAAAHYPALSARYLLLCLAGLYASLSGMTAQQAIVIAASNHYAALSDKQLDQCLLATLS